MNALHRVCMPLRVFPGTLDVSSMTDAQLEHAATAPSRLPKFLRRELEVAGEDLLDYTLLRPLATRTLRARLPTKLQSESEATTPGEFQSFVLLTGGRYLLSRKSEGFLQLWDLGIPGELGDTQRE
jgi:hypothetical protein